MFIIGVSAFFALLVFSPYIVGVMRQPPGITFVGVVHYPLDYYSYLSYMAQGKLRWLSSVYLNSTESTSPALYHWFYVLSGRVFATLGISNILGYQLLVLGLTILLLFVSYRLICEILPSREGRTIAYILFLTSNAWPYFTHATGGWRLQYYWSWYNYGEPFIRFPSIPHHLLAQSALVVLLLLLGRFKRGSQVHYVRVWLLLFVSGFLLASTQTPLVALVLCTYGIFWLKDVIYRRDATTLLPALILLTAATCPYSLYLRSLFQNQPYSSLLIGWEAAQNVHMTLLTFFQVNGPVVLLGIIGLPLFFSTRTTIRQIITVFTVLSWAIFFSPIPGFISVLNVRFLSIIPTIAMVCSAAFLIQTLTKRFAVRLAITLLLLAVTLPATVQQVITRSTFDPANGYYFLPNTVLDAYREVENRMKPDETCLVVWPFHVSFAALTGRRAFTTSQYSTLEFTAKEQQVTAFFSDTTPLDQKTRILKNNRISCVLTYSFTKNLPPALAPIYTNSYIAVYKVL